MQQILSLRSHLQSPFCAVLTRVIFAFSLDFARLGVISVFIAALIIERLALCFSGFITFTAFELLRLLVYMAEEAFRYLVVARLHGHTAAKLSVYKLVLIRKTLSNGYLPLALALYIDPGQKAVFLPLGLI